MMIAHKYDKHQHLKRSKSMCSLTSDGEVSTREKEQMVTKGFRSRTISNSSIEVYVLNESDSDEARSPRAAADSGLGGGDRSFNGALLNVLEQKIDKLSDMFLEQCRLLTTLKEEIRNSRTVIEKADCTQLGTLGEIVKKVVNKSSNNELTTTKGLSGGNSFLEAIEYHATDYDQLVREVISGFLQSDEVKEQMVQATAQSVKGVIGRCVTRDLSAIYLPVLEHSQRRLLRTLTKTVEDSFVELEENSACLSKSVYKMSSSLRRVIERHHCLLEAMTDPQKNTLSALKYSVEELLQKELKQWRQKVIDMFSLELQPEPEESLPEPPNLSLQYVPPSPPQPVETGRSVIDQLMISAEITKQIEEGDVNSAFERALCAGDLAIVMAACRAAARAQVFAPRCRLSQQVLLALLQQLSTDMLHDTQLKCRYIEDAILNLDLDDPNTRTHLPLVVGEIRKHLMKFIVSYPGHVANRRVALIKLAADNLLN